MPQLSDIPVPADSVNFRDDNLKQALFDLRIDTNNDGSSKKR